MATETNTFSALLDDVINQSRRPDRKTDIIRYIWQTLRECQVLAYFSQDMVETTVTAGASPTIWTVPAEFRLLRTVKYTALTAGFDDRYPKFIQPGKKQSQFDDFYYRSSDYFAFANVEAGETISLAYYNYFKKLPYFATANRPAVYDLETQAWTYLPIYDVDATTQQAARDLVTNWMLFNWYDLILEGALAKVLKIVGDPRSKSSFALFKSLQNDLLKGEAWESLGR